VHYAGYRIRISAEAADSLQRLLPPQLWKVFQETCAELKDNGHQLDAITGKATRWASGPPQTATRQAKAYNVDRAILRGLLLSGLSENVGFDMRFEGYRAAPNGGLNLDFSDHASIHTNLLIGADGVRSGVRRLRMPGLDLLDTEGRAVFGKTPITPGFFDHVPRELSQGLSLIGESNDSKMKLFCDTMTFDRARGEQAAQSLGLRLPDDTSTGFSSSGETLLRTKNLKKAETHLHLSSRPKRRKGSLHTGIRASAPSSLNKTVQQPLVSHS
jgi:hypothetical protein